MSIKKDGAFEMMEKKYGRLTLARALRAWREADNISQSQFAKLLGISVQSLCDLEKGRRIPTPVRAAKIAKKLGLPEMPMIQLVLRDSLFADGFKMNVKLEIA